MTEFKAGWQRICSRSCALLMAGTIAGYLVGRSDSPTATVQAEVVEEPRREAFKAGGVLNEPILREIAATLKRIETRVDRIEKNTTAANPREKVKM